MTRPTDDIEWGTSGTASVTEPSALKKLLGWIQGELPPAGYFNWMLRALWRWITFIDVRITVGHNDDGTHKDAAITLANMADLAAGTFIGRTYGAGTGVPTAIVNVPIFAGGGRVQKDVGGITILTTSSPGKEAALSDNASQQASSFAVSSNGVGVVKIYPRTDVSSTLTNYLPIIYPTNPKTFIELVGAASSPDYWTVIMHDETGTLVDGRTFYVAFMILTNP